MPAARRCLRLPFDPIRSDPLSEPHPPQLEPSPFRQRLPWWGADLQTMRDTLRDTLRSQRLPEDLSSALTIDLGDGDALLARLSLPQTDAPKALVVLIHGLGGCAEGPGIRRLAAHLVAAGVAVLRLNMRGAGAGRPLASGTYAALCNRDLLPALWQARQLADQLAAGTPSSLPLFGVGLSLGGTMLLNALLAEPLLDGLVCISSPLDLIQCADQFDRPRNRLYRHWVLRRVRQVTLEDPHGVTPAERALLCGPKRVRSLQAFDAAITAPRWGHASLTAYYTAASPLQPLLSAMETRRTLPPILLMHAADDPWVPVAANTALARQAQRWRCPWLETVITARGGHNGFHSRDHIERLQGGSTVSWADQQTTGWLAGRWKEHQATS
jgi:predicted alpha/beta-fold hydrolase